MPNIHKTVANSLAITDRSIPNLVANIPQTNLPVAPPAKMSESAKPMVATPAPFLQ